MKTKRTLILPVHDYQQALSLTEKHAHGADIIELRIDYLTRFDSILLRDLVQALSLPLIITLRTHTQGGKFSGTLADYCYILEACQQLSPAYLDVEWGVPSDWLHRLKSLSPETQLIHSYHCMTETPQDLMALWGRLQHPAVDFTKLITFANTLTDALRLLSWRAELQTTHRDKNQYLTTHAMGACGLFTRLLGAVQGNVFTYASLSQSDRVLPHILTLDEINAIYRLANKNKETSCYALIGDPVDKSLGHVFHNDYFQKQGRNALYVKIPVTVEALPDFFAFARAFPLRGLSVTMPLKQAVLPFLDKAKQALTINTLKITADQMIGCNTDGIAALDSLESLQPVNGKPILILGAGGAATAIMLAALKRGATVMMANRSLDKLTMLSSQYSIQIVPFESLQMASVSIFINTLPLFALKDFTFQKAIAECLSKNRPLVMDINYNQTDNPLTPLAKQYDCEMIDGKDMFERQALLQQQYWA